MANLAQPHRLATSPFLSGGLWVYVCRCGREFKAGLFETAYERFDEHLDEEERRDRA
jgi:hypothetical protein